MRISADEVGIHFRGSGSRDIVIHWGEIASVDADRCDSTDGSTYLEIYLNHVSGVDFRFGDDHNEYAEVMLAMEKHLRGFSRNHAEAAGAGDFRVVWQRGETA